MHPNTLAKKQTGRVLIGQGNISKNISLPAWMWDIAEEKGNGSASRGIQAVFEECRDLIDRKPRA